MNRYPVWVYPAASVRMPVCPENVYETQRFDEKAREILAAGGRVYLTPPSTKEALPRSIRAQFTTDFWSVGTFPAQEGSMGQLIDTQHPIFQSFPAGGQQKGAPCKTHGTPCFSVAIVRQKRRFTGRRRLGWSSPKRCSQRRPGWSFPRRCFC